MPAMHFDLCWPDASVTRCYSPSLVIKDHFAPGNHYPLPLFMTEVRAALEVASERVRAKFGFACSRALDQLAEIETTAARFTTAPDAQVEVLAFHE